jgi:hypothetical protein
LSIEPNDPRTISVEAVDGLGNPVSFTAAAEVGSCVTVLADPNTNSVTVTGVGELCDETITLTSDTGVTKTLEVKVYDPMVMDIGGGLLIKYVNEFRCRWVPTGTDGDYAGEFHHPVTEPGWYPLGSKIIDYYVAHPGNPPGGLWQLEKEPVIVVKELDPNASTPALAAPTGYEWIWDIVGTGAWYPGSVWKPVCPGGYVPLGVVTNNLTYDEPSVEDMRCVREEYTIEAQIGEWVYDAHGMGGYDPLIVHEIGDPKIPNPGAERALLNVGTEIACPGWDLNSDCDENLARLLLTPLPVMERSDSRLARASVDASGEIVAGRLKYASSARVPFTLIPMLDCEHAIGENYCQANVENYPFYRITRADEYTPATSFDNLGGPLLQEDAISQTIWSSWNQSRSNSFSAEIGISFTAGAEASFLGSGASWSVTVSATFGWDTTVTSTYEDGLSTTVSIDVPAYTHAVIARTTARLWARSENPGGPNLVSLLGEQNTFADGIRWTYLQYPPAFQ